MLIREKRKVMLNVNKIVFVIAFTVFLYSCDGSLYYEKFRKVDVAAWNYKDEINFTVPIDKGVPSRMRIAVRNTDTYQKANLWLFLSLTSPSGRVLRDTIDCPLADDFGYWLGSGFSGLYLTEHRVEQQNLFNEEGSWKVTITHGMREDTIKGIQEVGILVNKE